MSVVGDAAFNRLRRVKGGGWGGVRAEAGQSRADASSRLTDDTFLVSHNMQSITSSVGPMCQTWGHEDSLRYRRKELT